MGWGALADTRNRSHAPALRLTAMSLLSLTLILAGLLAALARAGDTVRLDSLVAQCKFMVDGVEFDLCPALQKQKQEMGWTGAWSVGTLRETPPTVTSDWYRISLDGPLPLNSSKPASMQVRRIASVPGRDDERGHSARKAHGFA